MQKLTTTIPKALFEKKLKVKALRVPVSLLRETLHAMHGDLWVGWKKQKCVIEIEGSKNEKLVLLKQSIDDYSKAAQQTRDFIQKHNLQSEEHSIDMTYDSYTVSDALAMLLPKDVVIPSAFETIGHIAHLNLNEEQLPYKNIIGQVVLDKVSQIRTVVNKMDSIDTVYRTFKMEVLAGEDNFDVELRESDCKFRFNFRQVYWNSRLQAEHNRLVHLIGNEKLVCDMFAGVGPFAIPLAVNNNSIVYANDLNPKSYEYLMGNAKSNKCENLVHGFNMDAREFVRKLANDGIYFEHVIMNLPASAVEFLDVFCGLWHGKQSFFTVTDSSSGQITVVASNPVSTSTDSTTTITKSDDKSNNNNDNTNKNQKKNSKPIQKPIPNAMPSQRKLPTIHCYGFSAASDPAEDIVLQVEKVLGVSLKGIATVHLVRDVAPKKMMMCVSFPLPASVAFMVPPPSQISTNNNNNVMSESNNVSKSNSNESNSLLSNTHGGKQEISTHSPPRKRAKNESNN